MQTYTETILSQYANSPTLGQWIENFNECIDPSVDIQAFYDNYWNIDTAIGTGLDVWGKILGVSRNLVSGNNPLSDSDYRFLLYLKAMTNIMSANVPSFNALMRYLASLWAPPSTFVYEELTDESGNVLTDTDLAIILVSDPTNQSPNAFVQDVGDMTIRYVFRFALTATQLAILSNRDLIPRPTGIDAYIMSIPTTGVFSFEAGNSFGFQPFFEGLVYAS